METAGWRAPPSRLQRRIGGEAAVVYARFLDPVPSELESLCCQA
jgi:hypothetical protein